MAAIRDKKTVARHLQIGIRAIANESGRTVTLVEDDIEKWLGIAARTVQSWKSPSSVPGQIEDEQLLGLAWLVLTRGEKDLAWLTGLLRATSIPVPDQVTRDWVRACLRGARLNGKPPPEADIEGVVQRLFSGEREPLQPVDIAALDRYHRLMFQNYEKIELTGLYEEQGEPVTLPLDRVFVSLELTGGKREEEWRAGPKPEPKSFRQALIETTQAGKHLVIVGGAGSGKTTFLRYAACALAEAYIKRNPALAEERIGLSGYIPLFLRLPDVFYVPAAADSDSQREVSYDDLIRAMAESFRKNHPDSRLADDFFERLVKSRDRRCLILLDGLDEVVTPPEVGTEPTTRRQAVAEAIRTLASADLNNLLVVTSRPDAYRGGALLPEPFLRWDVQKVNPEQRQELVKKWWTTACEKKGKGEWLTKLPTLQNEMDELEWRAEWREEPSLVETPLLISLLCLLYWQEKPLLQRRSKLFDRCLDPLLDLHKGGPVRQDLLRVQAQIRKRLPAIAFHMLKQARNSAAKEEILTWLLEEEQEEEPRPSREELARALDMLGERGALLVREGMDRYRFGIRSLQEYLAAEEMKDRWYRASKKELDWDYLQPHWLEVIRLCGDMLGAPHSADGVDFARCLRRLAEPPRHLGFPTPARPSGPDGESEARALYLSGLVLWEAWWWPEEEQQVAEETQRQFWGERSELIQRTWAVVRRKPPTVIARSRADAAGALGLLWWSPDIEFVPVPAGPFPMGTSDEEVQWLLEHEPDWAPHWLENGWFAWEQPQHEVDVPEFLIARFPVTFRQFRDFARSDGYENPDYWTRAGWDWVQHPVEVFGWTEETEYDIREVEGPIRGPRFGFPMGWDNRPAVGVNWYEAYAYCNWLDRRLREADRGTLPDELRQALERGYVIRLPTEAEWEKAASWDGKARHKRRYPWGDGWDPDRCNSAESQLSAPTPVGIYPHGAAACDAEEMAGNVWEWCHTCWGEDWRTPQFGYPYRKDERENPEGELLRVVRGGSWFDHRRLLRCAGRAGLIPYSRDYGLGVRVVCAPPLF